MTTYKEHWSYKIACQTIDEAMAADPDGLNRLVQSLLMKMKPEAVGPCRGHGACLVTGRCPFDPVCNN